jgi:hypothetical protein
MATGDINAGFMGFVEIDSNYFRFTDCSLTAKQDVNVPDLVGGSYWKKAFNYNKVEINGSMAGPIDEDFGTTLWNIAKERDDCGLMTSKAMSLTYFCTQGSTNSKVTFPDVLINQMTISCAAGEVAQFSIELVAAQAPTWSPSSTTHDFDVKKLVTWDKFGLTITDNGGSGSGDPIKYLSNFSFTLNNNVTPQWAMPATQGSTVDLYPFALVPGIVSITGDMTAFNIDGAQGFAKWDDYSASPQDKIKFSIGSTEIETNVRFHRIQPTSQVGPITSSIAFVGIGKQDGAGW